MSVITGDSTVVDALLFGMPTAATTDFVKREFDRFASSAIGDFGKHLVTQARSLYERFTNSSVVNMMQAAINQTRAISMADTIYRFDRMEDFQIAQPMMQTYIMANPMVRKLYHEQRCDGYSDSYVDRHPGKIGENHLHWQIVNNGLVKDEGADGISWTNYSGAFNEDGSLHMHTVQAHTMLATWRSLEELIAKGEFDPTSPWNGKL